jgi:probable HAF family extracellular repeat protein
MATMSWSQSLIWLDDGSGGHTWAYDVSANGSVVVGAFVVQGVWHAFRWEDGSLVDIGTLGGAWSYAYGVSADGSVVVGEAANPASRVRAFRWTWQGMTDIGTLGGCCSWAYDVSANGSVIVGYSRTASNNEVAFRWENGVMQALSSLYSHAYGVSANGSVVVGDAFVGNATQAVRWVNGVMQVLGLLPGGTGSEAWGVSANGDVVVGYGSIAGGIHHAFRWTAGTGMVDLGTLPDGLDSEAYGASADGSEVVGGAYVNWADDWHAFRWRDGVMEDLNDTYASLLTDGSYLRVAYAISPDGRYIVGYGYQVGGGSYGKAFLLDTGPRCTVHNGDVDSNGCVDDADLLAVLFAFGCSSGCGREDTNCDGTVDDADLLQVLFNFGSGC